MTYYLEQGNIIGDTNDNLKQTNIQKKTRLITWLTVFSNMGRFKKKKREFRDLRFWVKVWCQVLLCGGSWFTGVNLSGVYSPGIFPTTGIRARKQLDYDFWEPGSRVIVTTRNKQILSPIDEIYQVQDLSSWHSLQLFCLTVFGEIQPKDGYEDLSRRVISYCKGIPCFKSFGCMSSFKK